MSRVTHYTFNKISVDEVSSRLKYIISEEEKRCNKTITYDEQSIYYLANAGGGSMRDSITLLDKCLSYSSNLEIGTVINIAGGVDYTNMFTLTDAILEKDELKLISTYNKICDDGADLKQFVKCYLNFVLEINRVLLTWNFNNVSIPQSYSEKIKTYNNQFLRPMLTMLLQLNSNLRWETNPKIVIEGNLIGLL
jgi:DNA polymerase-3 subunit gamma/tau